MEYESVLKRFKRSDGRLTVLTGAGISAESGIPTFRGPEGYWTVGSKEYRPEEMATMAMFAMDPWEVWAWYIYRHTVCSRAEPNTGHLAIAEMEKIFGDDTSSVSVSYGKPIKYIRFNEKMGNLLLSFST